MGNGAPDFAALQAALSENKTDDLVYFAFDLMFVGNEDLRGLALTERKHRLSTLISGGLGNPRLRFVEHFATGGAVVLEVSLPAVIGGDRLQENPRALSIRTERHLGQVECRSDTTLSLGPMQRQEAGSSPLLVG